MKKIIETIRFVALLNLFICLSDAQTVPVVEVFGSNEKDNFGGKIGDMTNGSGMNGFEYAGEPDNNQPPGWPTGYGDPSTWSAGGSSYRDEWQSQDLLGDGEEGEDVPTNGKIAWVIFDLGASVTDLDNLYIWHVRENNGRFPTDFNVYVADNPTVAPFHGPSGNTSADYDFSSGGWSSVATGLSGTFQGDEIVNLESVTARYIALEIIDNNGDNNRAGFAEIGVTSTGDGTGGGGDLEITAISYDATADSATLTWRANPNATYSVFASTDLEDWTSQVATGVDAVADEDLTDEGFFTTTINLPSQGFTDAPKLFFRVEEAD